LLIVEMPIGRFSRDGFKTDVGDSAEDIDMQDALDLEASAADRTGSNGRGHSNTARLSSALPTDPGSASLNSNIQGTGASKTGLTSPAELSSTATDDDVHRPLPATPAQVAAGSREDHLPAEEQQPDCTSLREENFQRQLDEEKKNHEQTESTARLLHTKLSSTQFELEKEHHQRQNLEIQLKESARELEDIRKRWRQSAKELGQLRRANNQPFYQITDSYLIGLTEQLQYNLRSFAIQYFSSPPRTAIGDSTAKLSRYLEKVSSDYKLYANSPQHCQHLVQAFLWRVLCDRLFGQYYWMPGNNRKAPARLAKLLRPSMSTLSGGPEILPEMVRCFSDFINSD
jgi:hypothetical protein